MCFMSTAIRRYRIERNLTQEALAKQAGIHRQTLVRTELGKTAGDRTLYRIATALGVPVDDLHPNDPNTAR
jgi:transcriptional regulator with XRE-family HTH domain